MKLKHNVQDADSHFIFNPATRSWTYRPTKKRVLIQGDHNSEVFTFEFPRLIEGHDMSKCDAVQVHYINIDEVTREQSCGVFEVDDVQALSDDGDTLTCSWLISNNATKYRGGLSFLLRFACFREDGSLYYDWHSAVFSGVVVAKGINNGDVIVAEYPDILEQWKREIIDSGGATPELIEAAVGAYLEEHPIDAAYVKKVNGVSPDANGAINLDIDGAVETALTEAKASGTFDGKDGKDGEDGYTPVKGVDYFDGKDGKDGKDGEDGYTPVKGVDYFDGKDGVVGRDGYTPVKGVDYFDGEDGKDGKNGVDGRDGVDGRTPVKGVDYFDGKDGKDGRTPVKGVDYFDGKNGKDAYTYAKESGYTGTEAQFAAKLAAEMPTVLKNPHALTFTGGASGKYDGSEAKTVNIPTVPTALKNPNALTINGESYDGSSEVSISVAKAPLIGTASGVNRVTPQQVAEAVTEGRAVAITYPISGFECTFNSFDIRDNTVLGEILMPTNEDNNRVNVILLEGLIDANSWYVGVTGTLARMNDIPKMLPNPHNLTINGKTYDGSEPVTVNIEGGIDAEWVATSEIIGNNDIVIAEQTLSSGLWSKGQTKLVLGMTYEVYVNDVCYLCVCYNHNDGGWYLGNGTLAGSNSTPHNNEPFCILAYSDSATSGTFYRDSNALSYPLKLKVMGHSYVKYNKLPKEYLPDDIGGSIDVTAEVGQTIVVEEVDGSGKPTKWRAADFQERTHWSEEGFGTLIPHTVFTSILEPSLQLPIYMLPQFGLESGKTYTVIYDGVEYPCTAAMATFNGMQVVFIGNTYLATGTPTSEPFIVAKMLSGITLVVDLEMGTHTIQINGEKTIYHKPAPEYAPNEYWASFMNSGVISDEGSFIYHFSADWDELIAAIKSGKNIYANLVDFGSGGSFVRQIYMLGWANIDNTPTEDIHYMDALMFGVCHNNGNECIERTVFVYRWADGTVTVSKERTNKKPS